MTVPSLPQFYGPSPEQLRDGFLRKIAGGADNAGLTVNVLPQSEYHFRATALAAMVAPAYANEKVAVSALNPIDAVDDALIEMCETHGVFPLLAAGASGQVEVEVIGGGSVVIPDGFTCTAPNGVAYEAVGPVTVSDGDPVTIVATRGGTDTNQASGKVLRWDSAAISSLKQACTVDAGGLGGGTADETQEELRSRLLDRLSSPANGGNWAMVRDIAKAASSAVDAAFVYPAIQGPGSCGVVVIRNAGNRELEASVTNAATSALVAAVPGHTKWNVTSASAQEIDMVFAATLNDPPQANGPGGGWLDETPYPNQTSGPVRVTACNTTTGVWTLNTASVGALAAGTHLAVWDYAEEKFFHYEVVTATDMGATVDITTSPGPIKDHSGAYLSADAENIDAYGTKFLEYTRTKIGPGEKTANAALLPRAYRKPSADQEMPAEITSRASSYIANAFEEVRSFVISASYDTGTTNTRTSPSVPSASTDPPNILVLKHFAIIEL